MTEQELNVFLDLEWNCAAFTPEEPSVSAPLSPKQWARIVSRHPELQELCPFSEFTPDEWLVCVKFSRHHKFCIFIVLIFYTHHGTICYLERLRSIHSQQCQCAEWPSFK